jgi:hypothetical protein
MLPPYFNPFSDLPELPMMQKLTEDEKEEIRIKTLLYGCGGYALAFIIVIASIALFCSCATPSTIEQHHHLYQADTLAVQAAVDTRLQSWQKESEQWFRQLITQETATSSTHEDQRETITELITVTTDSVGRQIRTEQRTVSRALSRELQQQEQRLTREYNERLRTTVDSIAAYFQSRYDSLTATVHRLDTTCIQKMPAATASSRPWYRRWWLILLGALTALFLSKYRHLLCRN